MKNLSYKVAIGLLSLALVVGGGISLAKMFSGSAGNVIENAQVVNISNPSNPNVSQDGVAPSFGASSQSSPTYLTSYDSYTSMPSFYLWNSAGGLEVAGATYLNTTTVGRLAQGGLATALTAVATSSLTAAQICNSSFISVTPVSTTPTITLPSTTTLFAACIGTAGQSIDVMYQAITTSSILAAGAGGTAINSSALTVAAGKAVILRFVHDTASAGGTYIVAVINLLN